MANTILHKRSSTASAVPSAGSLSVGELAINTADGKLFTKKGDGSVVEISANANHSHGNITSAGAIGSTSGLPIITTTSGVLTVGSFGTTSGTFCQGNDSRLSDARTPTSHTHGNISNAGAIGSTSGVPIITGASGVLQAGSFGTAAGTFCQGNDARLSDARTPTSHTHAAADVTSGTFDISRIPTGSTGTTVCIGNDARLSDSRTPTSHAHGNITNGGFLGSTANIPLITGTSGIIQAGSFGSAANTFCQGNDSRLSDARTPTSHTHGNITNSGAIGSTSGLPIITGASGALQAGSFGTTAGTFCQGDDSRLSNARTPTAHNHAASEITSGTLDIARIPTGSTSTTVCIGNDARLSDARTPASHTHGNITNAGFLGTTANIPLITGTGGVIQAGSFGTAANTFCQGNDSRLSDARTPTAHTHAISEVTNLQTSLDGKAATSHAHGNITSAGAIGTTANLPLITTTSGVVTTGSFGTAANTFCQGNDSRLSDARTPTTHTHAISDVTNLQTTLDGKAATSHAHGNITSAGAIGSTSGLPIITTTSGVLTAGSFGTTAGTFCQGNDSRLSDARTPTSHTHGNITNAGAIGTTSGVPIITGASGVLQAGSFGTTAGTFCQGDDSRLSNARTPTTHTHAAADVTSGTFDIARIPTGSSSTTVCIGNDARLSDSRTPTSHTHGNITNAGAIGTTANLPVITTTSGVLTTGSFGTAANTFCQGNDSRLSDARTPTTHTHAISDVTNLQTSLDGKAASTHAHGNITSAGAIGSTSGLPLITTTSGVITTGSFGTTSGTFCQGNDSRLSDARTPTTHTHAAADVTSGTFDIARIPTGTSGTTVCIGNDARLSDARTPASHAHGNITNAGFLGSTANIPLITGTSGVIQAGSFGSAANTFCQGNDARLSDARTPTSHVHGNISNSGAIGSTSGVPIITGASGVLQAGSFGTTSGTFCQGDDSRLSDARTPTSHTHGNITNAGAIGATANLPVITTTSGVLTTGSFGTAANTFCQGNDSRLSDARTPTSHVHAATDITSGTLDNARTSATASDTASTIMLRNASKAVAVSIIEGVSTIAPTNGGSVAITDIKVLSSKVFAAGTLKSFYIVPNDGNIQTVTGTSVGTPNSYGIRYDGGTGAATTVVFTNGGLLSGSTATWHPSILFPGGVKPTLSSSGIDVVTFVNDGTNTLAFLGGLAFA